MSVCQYIITGYHSHQPISTIWHNIHMDRALIFARDTHQTFINNLAFICVFRYPGCSFHFIFSHIQQDELQNCECYLQRKFISMNLYGSIQNVGRYLTAIYTYRYLYVCMRLIFCRRGQNRPQTGQWLFAILPICERVSRRMLASEGVGGSAVFFFSSLFLFSFCFTSKNYAYRLVIWNIFG